jgi:hypothetical protein
MGVQSVLKWDPIRAARDWLASPNEKQRRIIAQRKRYLLVDNSEQVVRNEIARLFTDPTVKSRVLMFAHLAKSVTLFKRVIKELARPVYLVPPTRVVTPDSAQEAYEQIVKETYLDHVAPRWLTMALATGAAFAYPRYVERLNRIVIDVIPADAATVIPDPDDPCKELAIIYDKPVYKQDGTLVIWQVYWDDEISFQVDEQGTPQPFAVGEPPFRENTFKRIPIVSLHPYERTGEYWCTSAAESLVEANMAACTLTTLALRGLKARGFNQLVVTGDAMRFPKGQAMDEESAILAPDGTNVIELANAADASNYLAMIDAVEARAGAEYGISRARLNREKENADDTGLTEQRAEMIKLMAKAEHDLFEVLQLVSGETTDRQLPADANVVVDFGEYQFRTDPEAELRVWEQKRRMGVRNVLDQIMAENPEIRTDDDAWDEVERNMDAEAEYIKRRRALNIPEDANTAEPGQSPSENGKMGPMVRDGVMSKDEAAEQATGSKSPAPKKSGRASEYLKVIRAGA